MIWDIYRVQSHHWWIFHPLVCFGFRGAYELWRIYADVLLFPKNKFGKTIFLNIF